MLSGRSVSRRKSGRARARGLLSCALVVLCALCQAPAAAGEAPQGRIGINRVNLAWLSRQDQARVLAAIAASGATHVRLSLSRPVDRSIEALEIADRLGLRILLEIQLGNKDYYPEDVRPRSGFGRIWDVYRLSDLDLDRYRAGLRAALRAIDDRKIKLDAVEPGNEINYSAYNGDLLVYRTPGRRTPRGVAEVADREAFARGLDAYVDAVRITREALLATVHSRGAAVVSAGLSDIGTGEADQRGMERLDPDEVVALLRARGIDQFIDGYGIHLYPGRKSEPALRLAVTDLLDFCQPAGAGKPCWVTEWGIANTARSCPIDERDRERAIHAVRSTFQALIAERRLAAAFYYDWDTQPSYSVWRCGRLSPAGVAAIAPDVEGAPAR